MRSSTIVGVAAVLFLGFALILFDSFFPSVIHIPGVSREPEPSRYPSPPQPTAPTREANRTPAPQFSGPPARIATIAPLTEGATIEELVYHSQRYTDLTVLSINPENVAFSTGQKILSIPIWELPDDLKPRAYARLREVARFAPPPPVTQPVAKAVPAKPANVQPSPRIPQPSIAYSARESTTSIVKRAARERAARWFQFESMQRSTGYALNVSIDLEEPVAVSGWDGHWRVRGKGWVASYLPQGGLNNTANNFEVTVVLDEEDHVKRADFALF